MSRFSEYEDYDGDDNYNGNGAAMWEKRAQLALRGKRGRAALTEPLPQKRLIGRALCTVNPERREAAVTEIADRRGPESTHELFAEQGEGVCAIGAYLWYRNVKAGMDPQAAFAALPTVADTLHGSGEETARLGEKAGLTYTLAWELADQNDSEGGFGDLTPEQRYVAFLGWIDEQLAAPPLTRPEPKPKRAPRRGRVVPLRVSPDQIGMPL